MSLYLDNEIDPLALHKNGRQLDYVPVHFVQAINMKKVPLDTAAVAAWIWTHQMGRFSLANLAVSFEDPAEASIFALMSDQFRADGF